MNEHEIEHYAGEIEDDLSAARRILREVYDLFVFSQMDDDCKIYYVDAAKLNAVIADIELLRVQP